MINFILLKRMVRSVFLFCTLVFPLVVSAQYKNEFGATSDNDVYIAFYQDRYYTNGLTIFFRHARNQQKLKPGLIKENLEFEIGQKLYNPYSAKAPDPSSHDRPFTAYLYAGGTLNKIYDKEKQLRLSAQIGTIGPNAFGEETQKAFHNFLGIYEVEGWDYQLKNEAALNLQADYNQSVWKSKSENYQLFWSGSVMAGNTFSGVNTGFLLRFGKFNALDNTIMANTRISNNGSNERIKPEIFVYAKPQLNYVIYDATIQGGAFLKDKGPITFDVHRLVFSPQLGLSLAAGRWSANYHITYKTNEVVSPAKNYYYAGISLFYRFN